MRVKEAEEWLALITRREAELETGIAQRASPYAWASKQSNADHIAVEVQAGQKGRQGRKEKQEQDEACSKIDHKIAAVQKGRKATSGPCVQLLLPPPQPPS